MKSETLTQEIHPSTLGIKCERYLWKYYRKHPKEILPTFEMDAGIELERLCNEAIKNGAPSYMVDDFEIQVPQALKEKSAQFQVPIKYKLGEYSVSGRADFISMANIIKIIDYKQRFNSEIYKADEWQTLGYGYKFLGSEIKVELWVYFLRFGFPKRIIELDIFDKGKLEVKLLKEFKRIDNVKCLMIEPKPFGDWLCYYCPYIISCEPAPKTIEEIIADPIAFANRLIIAEAQYYALKQVAKSYTSMHGNIKTEGIDIGYFTGQSYDIDDKGLYRSLLKRKLDVLNFFKSDKKFCKSFAKTQEWITAFITMATGKPKFDIKSHKPKSEE